MAVLLALLSVLGVGAFEESDSALLDHVRKAGGFVGFKIGRESKGGIRGAYADQDFTGEAALLTQKTQREIFGRAASCQLLVVSCFSDSCDCGLIATRDNFCSRARRGHSDRQNTFVCGVGAG